MTAAATGAFVYIRGERSAANAPVTANKEAKVALPIKIRCMLTPKTKSKCMKLEQRYPICSPEAVTHKPHWPTNHGTRRTSESPRTPRAADENLEFLW